MVKIRSLAAHFLMRLGQQRHCLAPAVAALLAARDTPLRCFQRPFGFAIPTGREDARAIGEGGEGLNAKVDACLLSGGGKACIGHVGAGEADIPAVRFPADRDRLGRAFQGAAPAHGDAPNLGEDQKAVVQGRPVAELLIGEGVLAGARLIAREARLLSRLHAAKERLIGLVEPREHILQDVLVDGRVLWKVGADVLEFRFLLIA